MENFPEIDDHFRLRQLRVWVRGRIWIFRAFCPFSSSLALFLAAPLFCAYFYSRNSPSLFVLVILFVHSSRISVRFKIVGVEQNWFFFASFQNLLPQGFFLALPFSERSRLFASTFPVFFSRRLPECSSYSLMSMFLLLSKIASLFPLFCLVDQTVLSFSWSGASLFSFVLRFFEFAQNIIVFYTKIACQNAYTSGEENLFVVGRNLCALPVCHPLLCISPWRYSMKYPSSSLLPLTSLYSLFTPSNGHSLPV